MDRRAVRSALAAFVLSRLLLFALIAIGSQIAFLSKVYSNSVWETKIELEAKRIVPELGRIVMVGDAWWYRSIAQQGYRAQSAAFFPLYPLTVRAARITGDFVTDGVIVSNVALLAAFLLLGAVAKKSGLAPDDVERSLFYFAFFPTSYFLSFPLTESLFLALSLAAFFGAQHDRWWLAGIFGALAALTRFAGILLLPALVLYALQHKPRRRFDLAWLAMIPAGTAAFMIYLHQLTGDALAFVHAQRNWGRASAWFWEPVVAYITNASAVSEPWNFRAFHFLVALLLVMAGIAWLARREWAFGVYTITSVLLPLSSASLQSMARYALVVFPLFFFLAILGRRPLLDRMMAATLVLLYGWFVALMTLRVDFALA
ncbi:MAG TPA: hypothetical protein VN181_08030 [Thermoanaerobaculia bacterium]|nr:hypothetical protein [Thermoanaerobaculia bacterium]